MHLDCVYIRNTINRWQLIESRHVTQSHRKHTSQMKLCISSFGAVDKWPPQIIRRQRWQFIMDNDDDDDDDDDSNASNIPTHYLPWNWNWWLVSIHCFIQTKQKQIDELVNGFFTLQIPLFFLSSSLLHWCLAFAVYIVKTKKKDGKNQHQYNCVPLNIRVY